MLDSGTTSADSSGGRAAIRPKITAANAMEIWAGPLGTPAGRVVVNKFAGHRMVAVTLGLWHGKGRIICEWQSSSLPA